MSEEPNKEDKRDLSDRITEASAKITFENMETLCNQSEYTIGSETYKRKILKPKELVSLFKLQKEMDKLSDPERRMANLKEQALICLEGLTDEKWENTDAVKMEQVIGACLLISRGFRKV